jgi:Pyridoxamine 5'-phosphate oxidase
MRWADFERAAPELAALGMAGFGEQNLCLIGTLAADGWPRISPNEVYFPGGDLLLGMMRNSRKSKDLERDPRITVMTPQCDREAKRGDFKIYGRVEAITDPAIRSRYAQTVFEAIDWRPIDPYPLFAVDIERASYIDFADEHRMLRWSADRGQEELLHPDDDPNAGAPSE